MFLNNNSPIVNNMMGNGIYPGGYIPSNPIGNIVGIGTNGYNNMGMSNMGGYYNNQYNNYYNPYLAQQQRQLQEAQMREQMRSQTDVLKTLSRSVNKALGADIDMEKHLEQYNPENYYRLQQNPNGFYQQDEDEMIHNKLMNVHCNGVEGNIMNVRLIQANNILYDQEKEKRPDSLGIIEYNEKAGELCREIQMQQQRDMQRNLSGLYNSNQYNQLVKMSGHANSYFNSMFQGTAMQRDMNIDDMEVKLPTHLAKSYNDRKKAFFDAIMG